MESRRRKREPFMEGQSRYHEEAGKEPSGKEGRQSPDSGRGGGEPPFEKAKSWERLRRVCWREPLFSLWNRRGWQSGDTGRAAVGSARARGPGGHTRVGQGLSETLMLQRRRVG